MAFAGVVQQQHHSTVGYLRGQGQAAGIRPAVKILLLWGLWNQV
jgi:hypothetical protein